MKKLVLIQMLWLLLSLPAMAQYSLSGTVSAKNDGTPLVGAKVAINDLAKSTLTDAQGAFRLTVVATGRHSIRISAQDHRTYEQSIKISGETKLNVRLTKSVYLTDEVIISATRASEQTATTYDELNREEIQKRNFGQDFPFILNQMPSTVVTSDAGAGIGYTALRIRGTDPTRINVTINGIPLNDAESQGVFWVDLPDLATSVDNVQVQRGVGTSTNGAAAFGASINVQTTTLNDEPYAELNNSYGSFNSWKNTLSVGTGLIEDKFSFDVRLSNISSDGWVDRATSDLKSFFVSAAYYGKKSLVRFNVIAGKERTYQSWWGVPEALAKGDQAGLEDHIARNFYSEAERQNLRNSDRRYNYYTYKDQVDDYTQNHYQLLYSVEAAKDLTLNLAMHYTKGRGFFEQFREDDDFSDYALPDIQVGNETISSTDLIRRRYLDNDFYGFIYSANFEPNQKMSFTLGGGYNRYDGGHFGEIIWAQYASSAAIGDKYYENRGLKDDFNTYLKGLIQLNDRLSFYGDLQIRAIDYQYGNPDLNGPGTDNDLKQIEGAYQYTFFNPKAGFTYQLKPHSQLYASLAISNREPVRSDFIDAPEGKIPQHETLYNLEAGYRLKGSNYALTANYYLMSYHNQLVLNGEVNDVGAAVRQNVEASYRTGVEIVGQFAITPKILFNGNISLSQNKIKSFTESILDYADFSVTEINFENTDISFSPNVIAGAGLSFLPLDGLDISLLAKYVGKQYLDNTSNDSRVLDAFFVSDLRIIYDIKSSWAKNIRLGLLLNNLLNEAYEPNGYTYSYAFAGELITENFLYPQAGTNMMLSLGLRF